MKIKDTALIEALNQMLAQEQAPALRQANPAAAVRGLSVEEVAARLRDIHPDEYAHVGRLRQRILALGGIPTSDFQRDDLAAASP
jgi:bacterioferritin (cytochrome b1)